MAHNEKDQKGQSNQVRPSGRVGGSEQGRRTGSQNISSQNDDDEILGQGRMDEEDDSERGSRIENSGRSGSERSGRESGSQSGSSSGKSQSGKNNI